MAKKTKTEIVREECVSVLNGEGWIDIRTIHNIVQWVTLRKLPKQDRFGTDIKLLNTTLKQSPIFETECDSKGLVTWARLKKRRR